eukprot:g19405.t1
MSQPYLKKKKLDEVKSLDDDDDSDEEEEPFNEEDERKVTEFIMGLFPPDSEKGIARLIFAYCLDIVYLVAKDETRIPVRRKAAQMCGLIAKMTVQEVFDVKVANCSSEVLAKVNQYLEHHVDNPAQAIEKPLKSANMLEAVSDPWDAEFVDVPQELLFGLIQAANFLEATSLLDLCCAKVASMIKGKTPEQIRETFNITNDFTADEEAAVRAENAWAEDM